MIGSLKSLWNSRRFLVMMADIVSSMILYFSVKYIAPDIVDDIKFIIVTVQPAVLMLIYTIAKEDAAEKSNPNYYPPSR